MVTNNESDIPNEKLPSTSTYHKEEKLCNFRVIVKKIIHVRSPDGEFIQDNVKLKILAAHENFSCEIPLSEIRSNSKWIDKFPGLYINKSIGNGYNHLLQIINEQTDECKQIEAVHLSETGWFRYKGKLHFAHGGGAIPPIDEKSIIDNRIKGIKIITDPNLKEKKVYLDMIRFFEICPMLIMILTSFNVLSLMKSLLKSVGVPVKLVPFIEGSTGVLKTTTVSQILKFVNIIKYEEPQPQNRLSSTKKAILEGIDLWRDLPYIIDDLEPSERESMQENALSIVSEVIRIVGDDQGREVYDVTKRSVVSLKPNGAPCITGEYFINNGSSVARAFNIKLKSGDVNTKLLSKLQDKPFLMPTLLTGLIEYISKKSKPILKYSRRLRNASRSNHQKNRHRKTENATAMLYLGFKIFVDYGLHIEAISEKEAKKLINDFGPLLSRLSDKHSKLVNQKSPKDVFLNTFAEMYDANALPLKKIGEINSGNDCGWEDSNYFYLLPTETYSAISTYLSRRKDKFPLKFDRFMQMIKENEICQLDSDEKISKHIVYQHRRIRVMKISRFIFNT